MSIRTEFIRQRKQIEQLEKENVNLMKRLDVIAGVVDQLLQVLEERK